MHYGKFSRGAAALAVAAWLWLPAASQAVPVAYQLSFETSGQSIWNTGESFTLNQTTFLGAQWQDKTAGFDLIVGNETNNVPNPLRITYDAAFAVCNAAFSASACINGQTARVPVPALGSRPPVRSCGTFAVACKIAAAADLVARGAYDVAFAACRGLGNSASVCRNGQSGRLPVVALGTAPPQFLNVDTRTGIAATATSDGRVGLELGIAIDSGSVNATVSYLAELDIPDTAGKDKSIAINFNPNSQLAGLNTLDTSFSSIELSVDAIMELSGNVTAEACIIPAGCTTGGTSFNINERAPIISFNKEGEGEILILGQTPSDLLIPNVDGLPADIEVAGIVTTTIHLPQPSASGGLDVPSQKLKAEGQDDFVDIILDVDNAIATAAGVPGLFGSSVDVGPLGSVGFDIINVEMGPTIDLKQEFELDPTLFVTLIFDKAVSIAGELITEWTSAWDLLPDITFLDDITNITPIFFLEADLLNNTLLDFDFEFGIDLLQVFYDFGLLGDGTFGIGNVLDQGVDLFDSPNLFSNLFSLQGFNLLIGDDITIDFLSGSLADTSALQSAINVLEPTPSVPEPGAIFLFLTGLAGLYAIRRRYLGGTAAVVVGGTRSSSMA